jgi:diguanylate cyclase
MALASEPNITASARPYFARLGGDEFVLLVEGLQSLDAINLFALRLQQAASQPVDLLSGDLIEQTVSIGVTCYPWSDDWSAQRDGEARSTARAPAHDQLESALQRADVALYHAKTRGKAQFCLNAPGTGIRSIGEMQAEIARAIADGQMVLHFQPKIASLSGKVSGVEALVRWNHPQHGLVMPASFIPVIEDSPVIADLGEWVLRAAASHMCHWRAQGRQLDVAINIAAFHYGTPGFAERMLAIAAECGLPPQSIVLEITEEAAMSPTEDAGAVIAELKKGGFQVALDDYGRGYSNLQRLAQISVDAIKIDRSLIAQVNEHERTREIVAATVAMADALKCRVVAEGIENAAHAATLRKLGCHELQGYYFAKPMPAEMLDNWLEQRSANAIAAMQGKLKKNL